LLGDLYRPSSILWDGTVSYVLLEGHGSDIAAQARTHDLTECAPPALPGGGRTAHRPRDLGDVTAALPPGSFLAEVGVGIVHHRDAGGPQHVDVDAATRALHRRIKQRFDPTGRLNPGLDVLASA
jgi:glycolate oxidase FAD binding subunit